MNALPGEEMNLRISSERGLPVLDDVGGKGREPGGRAVYSVDDGDGLLDLLAFDFVEAEGRLVGGVVEIFFGDALRRSRP